MSASRRLGVRVTRDAPGGRTLAFGDRYNFASPFSRPLPTLDGIAGMAQELVFGYAAGNAGEGGYR